MRQLESDDGDLAVRTPGGVPQVSSAHHSDSRVQEVVAVAVRRVPGTGVAAEEIVRGPRRGVRVRCGCGSHGVVGRRPRRGHRRRRRRQIAQPADQTAATRVRRGRGGRPVQVRGHGQNESPATDGRRRTRAAADQFCRRGRMGRSVCHRPRRRRRRRPTHVGR